MSQEMTAENNTSGTFPISVTISNAWVISEETPNTQVFY